MGGSVSTAPTVGCLCRITVHMVVVVFMLRTSRRVWGVVREMSDLDVVLEERTCLEMYCLGVHLLLLRRGWCVVEWDVHTPAVTHLVHRPAERPIAATKSQIHRELSWQKKSLMILRCCVLCLCVCEERVKYLWLTHSKIYISRRHKNDILTLQVTFHDI